MSEPNVIVLAGPNGSGKTTASRILLSDDLRVTRFVNADTIAQGLAGIARRRQIKAAVPQRERQRGELELSDSEAYIR